MSDELMDRRALERDLRAALADGALRFVFQPKRRLSDRALVGVETLVRWQRTSGDIVSPAAFVAVAEQTGLIEELGLQALEAACRAAARWRRTAGAPFTVAVNASVVQLKRGDFAAAVEAALARHGLPAAALIVEITENVFIDDDAEVQAALRRLGATGVRLALDDFGTGYASLGYLRRLPFSELKIDRSFVRDLAGCADARALVRAIVGLGHALDMKVTAEGIETPAQLAFLAAEGCDDGQGYLLGRPQEAGGIDRLLAPTAVPGDLEAL